MRKLSVLSALVVLVAAACGSGARLGEADSGPAVTAASTTPQRVGFPVTVSVANGEITVPEAPQRIVSLSATHTEVLYALGAGDRVVATDNFSDYPPQAAASEKIDAFQLNVEAVAGLDPDLVILAFDPGEAVAAFRALGIPTLLFDAAVTLEDAFGQAQTVGAATGYHREAEALVASMRQRIDDVVSAAPRRDRAPTYYHELDPTFYTATSETFVGGLYAMFGMVNIADAADQGGLGYPQLSVEYILQSDPDFLFLADTKCCAEDAATVGARPGWEELSAVREGRVIQLDDDVASRWGPRLVELVEAIAAALARWEAVP